MFANVITKPLTLKTTFEGEQLNLIKNLEENLKVLKP
jgi:hypothetical protein